MAFKDPIDEEADAAESTVVKDHAGKLAERIGSARDEDTEEVPITEPDEDEEDALTERQQKRNKRSATHVSARERAAAAEARAEAYKEALALAGRDRKDTGPGPGQVPPTAEIDSSIRRNYAQQEALHDEYNARVKAAGQAGLSKDEEQRFKDRAIDLDVENKTLVADRRDAVRAPQRAEAARVEALKARAPDVYNDARAFQFARGLYNQEIARGMADSLELHDSCMEQARQVIFGKRPKPDAIQKQRLTGMGGGTRAPAGGEERQSLSMPKGSPLYRMAIARYPDLEPAQACQKWAQKSGKAYLERVSSKR